jgi:hypothetical protein
MPKFRSRLSPAERRVYDRSDAATSVRLRPTDRLRRAVAALPEALADADVARVGRIAQAVADEITGVLRVRAVRVQVHGTRPSNASGELHGLYTAGPNTGANIELWMLTAKRGQVVAFKTFLRTLLHEICHHLDYTLLALPNSYHSDGFYKRESSLFHQIGAAAVATRQSRSSSSAAPSRTESTQR